MSILYIASPIQIGPGPIEIGTHNDIVLRKTIQRFLPNPLPNQKRIIDAYMGYTETDGPYLMSATAGRVIMELAAISAIAIAESLLGKKVLILTGDRMTNSDMIEHMCTKSPFGKMLFFNPNLHIIYSEATLGGMKYDVVLINSSRIVEYDIDRVVLETNPNRLLAIHS